MAGKGGGDTGKSSQVTEVKLPEWVNQASQSNYARAQDVANRPYEANPYGGAAGVAGFTPTQEQAFGMLPSVGQYQGAYGSAQDALTGLLGYNPTQVQAGMVQNRGLPDVDLQKYLNPYTSEVEANTVRQMQQDAAQAQQGIASAAAKGGSFGGSRQAIQQAVQGAQTTKDIGNTVAQLRSAGYDKATAQATADLDRAQKGDLANLANWTDVQKTNVSNQLAAKGLAKGAADSLVAAATAGQQSAINTLGQYLGVGAMQQQQQQKLLDAQSGQWQQQRDYPLEQLNVLLSSLGMSPYGKTEVTNKTSEQKGGSDFGSILGGAAQMAPVLKGLFALSDRTMKTDITPLGKDESTGLPVYAYRYKGDPKSYPKVVGPMAQDIAKRAPSLVRKVAGKRVIDLTHLAA